MNKGNLVQAVAAKMEVKPTAANALVGDFMEILKTTLLSGEEVTLPGLGKLKVSTKPAREGRNPATGAAISIPAKRVVKFSPASDFKAALT